MVAVIWRGGGRIEEADSRTASGLFRDFVVFVYFYIVDGFMRTFKCYCILSPNSYPFRRWSSKREGLPLFNHGCMSEYTFFVAV